MDGLVKTLGTVLLLLAAAIWAAVLLLAPAALLNSAGCICSLRLAGMKTYEVVLKGCGPWLAVLVDIPGHGRIRGRSCLQGEEAGCGTLHRI